MIFVTVGNHYQGFDRLVKKMDNIAGIIDEKVIMQIGYTKYHPVNAEFFNFKEKSSEIQSLNNEARIIVCHAGAGSIITAYTYNKPVIIVPRLKKYSEHNDDHQKEIAEALSGVNGITVIYDINDLELAIKSELSPTGGANGGIILKKQIKKYLSSI